ncbi:MAG: hypothetical protein F6K42_31775, partial [Leptolyngbya sp. SIO1D8]|nr:hypothetical protein [Leptolyngbya sp. SIO1D8]
AVAAFVFGCLVEVVLSNRQEPTLPLQHRQMSQTEVQTSDDWLATTPQLPHTQTVLANHESQTVDADSTEAFPETQAMPISYRMQPGRDRPNVVNSALEPVGVIQHERLLNPADDTVTLVFGGDVSLDDLPYSNYETDSQLLSGVSVYQQADIAMVNLDDSLATAATSLEEDFLNRQRPEVINLLKEGGVDIVNLTSAEILSFGEQGLAETLETLDRSGIYRVGAGRTEREARRPEVLDVKGQRIAYLSYDRTEVLAAYGSVGGVNAPGKHAIIEDIQAIRDEVDWLVVNYRWMEEIPDKPAEFQTNLARLAIDQGADLVVGHHPTQLQGAEIYKGRPIAYSLGDFVFGTPTEETTPESAVLQVSLRDRQMKVDLIPVKVQNGQPQRVSDVEADAILHKIQVASEEFDQPMEPSVVLDAQPGMSPDTLPSDQDGDFVEGTETTPSSIPDLDKTALPSEAETNKPLLNVPIDANDDLNVDMDPIPEGLLDNWGPKTGDDPLYEPESVLPEDARLNPIKPTQASPKPHPSAEEKTSIEEIPAAASEAPMPEIEERSPNDAIAPYSEPLIGPLSALPATLSQQAAEPEPKTGSEAAETEIEPIETEPEPAFDEVALVVQQPSGLPQARVFEPLSSLHAPAADTALIEQPVMEKPLIIDAQKYTEIVDLASDEGLE